MDVASSPFSDPVASFASESEHQLRFITDALPALVSYVDTNERYTYVNNSYCKWFGQSRENIIGKHIREIVGEDAYASLAPYVYKVLSGKEVSFEALMPYATAGMRYVSASYTPQFDNDGKVKGFVVLAIDISQQKSVEEELRQNQQELSDFLENSPVGIQWFDASGKIIYANRTELELLGYTKDEYLGRNIRDFHADPVLVDEMFAKLFNHEQVYDLEAKLIGKDGRQHYVLISSNVLWKNGKFAHARCFTRNITDRKLVEEYLREKNKTLQILNSIGNTISANLDLRKLVQAVTDATTEICGAEFGVFFYKDQDNEKDTLFRLYSVSGSHQNKFLQFYSSRIVSAFTPLLYTEQIIRVNDTDNDIENGIAEVLRSEGITDHPFRSYMIMPVISKNGELFGGIFFGHSSVNVFSDRSEILVESIALQAAIAIDNSRLFEAKQAGEERFRALAESVPQVIWTALADGNLDYVNQKWTDFSGQPFEEALDSGWLNVVFTEDTQRTAIAWMNALSAGTIFENELRLRRTDGHYRWHLCRALPIKDKSGTIIKWFGTFTDIHDQKMLNEKKDEFIGIASHELKTPLTSIKAYVQLLERQIVGMQNPAANTYIEKTQIYIDRLHHLIADLLDVSRIQAGKLKFNMAEFDFDEFISESVDNIQYTATKKIIISGEAGCSIRGDRQRLEQVCTNLISNAIKYSPKADKVMIHVSKEANEVKVAVTDFGIGIPKENLGRVFDRFYRVDGITHQFQGLGIGLYIAHEIITRHHGRIWAESEEGRGSTFFFTLPVKGVYTEEETAEQEKEQ
jgi:PAS domain S-box-containing protein